MLGTNTVGQVPLLDSMCPSLHARRAHMILSHHSQQLQWSLTKKFFSVPKDHLPEHNRSCHTVSQFVNARVGQSFNSFTSTSLHGVDPLPQSLWLQGPRSRRKCAPLTGRNFSQAGLSGKVAITVHNEVSWKSIVRKQGCYYSPLSVTQCVNCAQGYHWEPSKESNDINVPLSPTDFHGLHQSYAYHFFHAAPSLGLPSVGEGYARTLAEAKLAEGPPAQPGVVLDRADLAEDIEGQHGEGSYADKGRLKLFSGACSMPHPDKVDRGGEDAHFICANEYAVGVADGVGGWAEVGVDAGLYARSLMGNSMKAIKQEPLGAVDPIRVLCRAHALTKVQGSSTACILVLADDKLQAANLGDSGFVLIRSGRTIFRSPSQTHGFNFPYQLGSDGSDPPEAAQAFALTVAAGDVLVVGTDGLFDNVYETELSSVVMHSTRAGWGPYDTAQKIAALARNRALDRMRQTPFSKAAQDAGYRYQGGKLDDITVVCSFIQEKKEREV